LKKTLMTLENPPPSAAPSCLTGLLAALAPAAAFAVGIAAVLMPSLWNGFALVFFDSGGYVRRVLEMELTAGRSIFYGLFLWGGSLGWWNFYGPVLLQALACVWLIHLMLRCHQLSTGPWPTAFFSIGLSLTTGIGWSTGQLLPDALLPPVVLALWLLAVYRQCLSKLEQCGLASIALLGLLSHMSAMALAIGLLLVIVLLRCIVFSCRYSLSVRVLPPLAVVTAALLLMPLLHLFLVGKAVYTPGGPVYIFGRLAQAGIAQLWLAEHCPVPGIKLCDLQDRIPHNGDEFLWGEKSAFRDLGEWSGAADAELGYLVKMSLKAYPMAVAWSALQATAQQMVMVKSGDQLTDIHNDTRDVFTHLLPSRVAKAFNAAQQQQGGISQSFLDGINRLHVPVAHLSVLCLLLVIAWGLRCRRYDLAAAALYVFLALLGNAFICGALSNPHDRYQSRLVWLAPLIIAMAAMGWWRARKKGLASSEIAA
jgi:hypothetical protein